MRRMRPATIATMCAAAGALALLAVAGPAATAEGPTFSVDNVLVNRTGGITALGTVDCSAVVLEHWGSLAAVPPETYVYVNVGWTANQPQGRKMITATFDDGMASPCWANATEFLDEGRCVANSTQNGAWYGPCKWDSGNYGSDGWIYGNGRFNTSLTHVQALLTNGIWNLDPWETFDFYQYTSADLKPVRVK